MNFEVGEFPREKTPLLDPLAKSYVYNHGISCHYKEKIMKLLVSLCLSLLIVGCSNKSGEEEKELATQQFINCDFYSAISSAKLAISYAGDDVSVLVPSYLIIGKSSEVLGLESSAYDKIVELVPNNVPNVESAKRTAREFVERLSNMVPEKVEACEELQG